MMKTFVRRLAKQPSRITARKEIPAAHYLCATASSLMMILCFAHDAMGASAADADLLDPHQHYKKLFESDFVSVQAVPKLSPEMAKQLADDVENAYDYVKREDSWLDKKRIDEPIVVRLRQTMPPDRPMATVFPNLLFMTPTIFAAPNFREVLGAQLSRFQDERQNSGIAKIPPWLTEGRAWLHGINYSVKCGTFYAPPMEAATKSLGAISKQGALAVLSEDGGVGMFGGSETGRQIGGFFLEFMRTKCGGKGYPDMQIRCSRIAELIAQGMQFSLAFEQAFGVSLAEAKTRFGAYLLGTQDRPSMRFAGTVFEKFAITTGSPSSPNGKTEAPTHSP